MGLAMGMENAVEAALLDVDEVFSEGVIEAPIRRDRHDLPRWQRRELRLGAGEQDPLALLVGEAVRNEAGAAFAAIDAVPISRELTQPALQGGVSPTPSKAATSRARDPAATAPSRISKALRRSAGEVNPPRPLPSRPGSFLRRTASQRPAATAGLPPPPGPCPHGATPAAAA
jgi:hypothetical protein